MPTVTISSASNFCWTGFQTQERFAPCLEGEELRIELGHTDTANSTALSVPSIGLVVSGDAVHNNTHPYLAECDEEARNEWLRALDKIEALHPKAVIAGHGVLDPDSSPPSH